MRKALHTKSRQCQRIKVLVNVIGNSVIKWNGDGVAGEQPETERTWLEVLVEGVIDQKNLQSNP